MSANSESAPARLEQGLRSALAAHPEWSHVALEALADRGLAHVHIRLVGTGLLARVPKQSQVGLGPQANLVHQAACFERAEGSRHTPRLIGALPVSDQLPRGALLVEEIAGRHARIPSDLAAIAAALGAVHALPLPATRARAPLSSCPDPLRSLLGEVDAQAKHLPGAGLDPAVVRLLQEELETLRRLADGAARPGVQLIAFDAHPGNFILRPDGSAFLVDLEKCRYSHPGLDLAHATLYTSTTWDVDASAVLRLREVIDFYRRWELAVGAGIAVAAGPWHVPLRRAMWLWSITWCCQWRAVSHCPPQPPGAGQDWSVDNSDADLVAHVRERVDHYLSLAVIERVRQELHALRGALTG
ncbi:MAG TPA: hypothetical protein VGF26_26995 [Ramlibacter sp.]